MLSLIYIQCDKQSWRQPSSSLACSADPRLKPRKGRRKRKPPTESMEDQELRRPGKVEFPTWSVGIDTRAYTSTSLLRFSNTSEPEWHNGRKDMVIIPLENERLVNQLCEENQYKSVVSCILASI